MQSKAERFVSKKDKMNDILEDFFGDVTCKDTGNSSVDEGNKQPPSPKRSPTLVFLNKSNLKQRIKILAEGT